MTPNPSIERTSSGKAPWPTLMSNVRRQVLIRIVLVPMAIAGCGISPQEPLAPAVPALYHLEVEDAPAENGKRLNMSLREVQRAIDHSLVEVSFVSGGSVSSSMFVFRGMCGL